MKFYLSSYKIGSEVEKLKQMIPKNNKRCAYIANALDFSDDLKRRGESEQKDIGDLKNIGLEITPIDLRLFFDKQNDLLKTIRKFGVVWIRGGNVFVLRQAMKLSGLDKIIIDHKKYPDIVYGGYSAGGCILSPSLHGYEIVDDVKVKPYGDDIETIWEGLKILDTMFVPHYKSDHPESALVEKSVQYFHSHKIPITTLRDGGVMIIE